MDIKHKSLKQHIFSVMIAGILFLSMNLLVTSDVIGRLEGILFPVEKIIAVNLIEASHKDNMMEIGGEMIKMRKCAFLSMKTYIVDRNDNEAEIKTIVEEPEKIRPMGKSTWRFWIVNIDYNNFIHNEYRIRFEMNYHCHMLWNTITVFTNK